MCACAVCLDNARVRTVELRALSVCTVVLRALGVCTVVHVVLLRAWGSAASESLGRGRLPHPNPKGRHVPTTQRPHTPLHHLSLFH